MSVDTPTTGWRRFLPLKQAAKAPLPSAGEITLVDAFTGHVEKIKAFPSVLHGDGADKSVAAITLDIQDGVPHLLPHRGDRHAEVNGGPLTQAAVLVAGEVVTLRLENRFSYLCANADAAWPGPVDPTVWTVFEIATGHVLARCAPREIGEVVAGAGIPQDACAACPDGMDTGFAVDRIVAALNAGPEQKAAYAGDTGKHFCPACWLRFDSGDALSIATHEELSGDPLLGPDHRLRFQPTRFNDAGQALDPMGLPAPDIACPYCRRQLPHGYLDTRHHILSIVGAPGAGKSYLLAVLTKVLQDGLFRDFGVSFRDDDPTGNLMLNQMRSRLFSALTPEEAILSKTALEGSFYERLHRQGRTVALPRPFVYSIRDKAARDTSFIFYDNAGEHFEPGLDPESSPGALHVARSSGIFFLFDPTCNANFRVALTDLSDDPQLNQSGRIDQQDTLLAEMDVRIKRMLGLPRDKKIATPIAVLVGKCDVWAQLFDAKKLPDPVVGGKLDLARVASNSDYLRSLLLDYCPSLVGGAEAISDNVRYFAVSPLGHSPSRIAEGPKAGMLAPDPKKLAPYGLDRAAYWLISQSTEDAIPVA